jgi:hypothetical protein
MEKQAFTADVGSEFPAPLSEKPLVPTEVVALSVALKSTVLKRSTAKPGAVA